MTALKGKFTNGQLVSSFLFQSKYILNSNDILFYRHFIVLIVLLASLNMFLYLTKKKLCFSVSYQVEAHSVTTTGERCNEFGMKVLKFSEKKFQNLFQFQPPTETSFGDQPSISQFIFTFLSVKIYIG